MCLSLKHLDLTLGRKAGMEFEVQELEDDDKPPEKPQKLLLEDPLHKGSTLPGFHLAKEPPKKKPW